MITLKKMREISSSRCQEICIVDKGISFTWQQIVSLTEERIAFIQTMYKKEQISSACYISKNNVDIICWLAAFSTLGISANGLDYSLPVNKLANLIKKIEPDILLISHKIFSTHELNTLNTLDCNILAIGGLTDPIVKSIGEYYADDVDFLINDHKNPPFRAVSLTSGTSSLPKIALRYQSFDSRRFAWFTERYDFSCKDGFLLILPLYHAAGNGWARMFMGLGSTIFIADPEDDNSIIYALSHTNVTTSVMTPNLVNHLTRLHNKKCLTSNLRWVLVGGSYFSEKGKQEAINLFGSVFHEYYGCTETGVNVLSEPPDMEKYPRSVGRAFEGNLVAILDEKFQPVATGVNGRVAIASYMLMDEYLDGTRPFHLINGIRYFLMADHGYLDEQGRLFLMNRNGDTNIQENLYGIEENIRTLPCISDVAVIPVIEDGTVSVKCIFSTNQGNKVKLKRLIQQIKDNIKKHNINKIQARIVEKIPYSPSGKVRFNEVMAIFSAPS